MTTAGSDPPLDSKAASASRRLGRSFLAIFSGFVAVVVLSLGTDQLLHVLDVYPPWGQPMNDIGDNLLALSYRCVYGVVGSYVTARFAPRAPMVHVWIGAGIGFVLSIGGIVAASNMNLGPLWYPVALTLTALPCAWLGGFLFCRTQQNR